jgi:hypothetical protein
VKRMRPQYLLPHHDPIVENVSFFLSTLHGLSMHEVNARARWWLIAQSACAVTQEVTSVALEVWPRVEVSKQELRERRLEAFVGNRESLTMEDYFDLPALRPLASGSELPTSQVLREEVNRRRVRRTLACCWKIVVEARQGVSDLVRSARFNRLLVWPVMNPATGLAQVHFGGPLQVLERSSLYAKALNSIAQRALGEPGALVEIIPHKDASSSTLLLSEDPLGFGSKKRPKFDSRLEQACFRVLVRALGKSATVNREPSVVKVGRSLVIPDFSIEFFDQRPAILLEIVGFWTESYLAKKRQLLLHPACKTLGFLVEKSRADSFLRGLSSCERARTLVFDASVPEHKVVEWIHSLHR